MSPTFLLRSWQHEDLDSLVYYANNPCIAGFMTDQFPHPYTREAGERFITFARSGTPNHIFAIDIEGKACGGIGIHPQSDIYRKNAELGYWLAQAYWNRGIVSKAIPEVVEFAFRTFDVDRIYARPFGSNHASRRVLEKNGFKLEALIPSVLFKNERYEDELIFALRRNQF